MAEANVKDVKLTVLDILGRVSLGFFSSSLGVDRELPVSPKDFVVPVPDDLDPNLQRALHIISVLSEVFLFCKCSGVPMFLLSVEESPCFSGALVGQPPVWWSVLGGQASSSSRFLSLVGC